MPLSVPSGTTPHQPASSGLFTPRPSRTSRSWWMPLAVKKNEAPDPVDVGLFGAQAVMLDAAALAHLIEKTELILCLHGDDPSLGNGSVSAMRPMWNQRHTFMAEDYTTHLKCFNIPYQSQDSS